VKAWYDEVKDFSKNNINPFQWVYIHQQIKTDLDYISRFLTQLKLTFFLPLSLSQSLPELSLGLSRGVLRSALPTNFFIYSHFALALHISAYIYSTSTLLLTARFRSVQWH
jgi:hypothetical protein